MGCALAGGPVEHVDEAIGVNSVLGFHCERFPGELVRDVPQLHRPTVLGDVELEAARSHVIGLQCPKPIPGYG